VLEEFKEGEAGGNLLDKLRLKLLRRMGRATRALQRVKIKYDCCRTDSPQH